MRVLILGAGGHAKVVADTIETSGHVVVGFLDDDPGLWGKQRLGLPVLGSIAEYADFAADGTIVAIGSNQTRKEICGKLEPPAHPRWVNALHPHAILARSARLGVGDAILTAAVVNADTEIGDHVIINTGATVDHDCRLSSFAHIGPGAHLAGGVVVGRGVLIGIGASVAPGCVIGDWAIIGAGATVIHDIPDRVVATGTPARWKEV
ncbi:MAG: acetyltransferase [Anaerolineae bacterium]|nr:acetyltransferase [Anaerolineae bacterium]